MSTNQPDSEIFEFAIHREIEAYRFYMGLAERIDNSYICGVLKELAEEELEHKAKLELEWMKLGQTIPTEQAVPVSDNDIPSESDSQFDMDYKELLMLAIEKEEASFRTYVNLLSSISDQPCREVLLGIAEEEVRHKLRFETEYDMLLKKS